MYLDFALPESSRNRLIKAANLIKKGFAKWEEMPKTTRNIATGVSFLVTGIALPKALFLLTLSSVFAGRHMYLSGEVKEAAEQIVVDKPCSEDCSCSDHDLGHP
jgi:hypothetical protein